jgi:type III pantothenate kinase
MQQSPLWLALVVGNSRLHWGAFEADRWLGSWHTPHLSWAQGQGLIEGRFSPSAWQHLGLRPPLPAATPVPPELWVASVVRPQIKLWAAYPEFHRVETAQVPLQGTYPTLGVDRALTLVGAGVTYGWPVLVIDCGTALTFTAGAAQRLVGGAILPGLRSQLQALHDYTDGLPQVQPDRLVRPPRWATTTAEAMVSGVFYSQIAGIRDFMADWWTQFPDGTVILTGGEAEALASELASPATPLAGPLQVDPDLMFWGLQACRRQMIKGP